MVEADIGARNVGAGQLGRLQPLDFLFAGGHLAGAGSGGEAGDEFLELFDLLFTLLVLGSMRVRICVLASTMSS